MKLSLGAAHTRHFVPTLGTKRNADIRKSLWRKSYALRRRDWAEHLARK